MGNKIKVLFLVNIPSPYRVDFFNELGKKCELTVLFERETSEERDKNWFSGNFNNFQAVFLKGIKMKKNTALSFEVLKYLKKDLFDVIVVGGYSTPTGMLAIETLKKRKIPFILNSDGGIIRNDKRFRFLIKSHFIKSASFWLSTSEQTTDYLVNYGAKKDSIFIYPFTSLLEKDILENPLPKKMKNDLRKNLNIKEDKIILTIGQFIDRKGFDILLKAVKDLPSNYGIYFIGGIPTQEYINLKNQYNLSNVHFIGFKSKEELKEFYLASDLFVLPTREDIWGLVINEAMAHGLPVITTNKCVAGLELVKDNENGFIIPANNINTLKNRIIDVLKSQQIADIMAQNSLDRIQNYTIEGMARSHINIITSILNKEKE